MLRFIRCPHLSSSVWPYFVAGNLAAVLVWTAAITPAAAQSRSHISTDVDRQGQGTDGVVFRGEAAYRSDIMQGFPVPRDKRVSIDNWHQHVRWLHLNTDRVFKSTTAEKRTDFVRPFRRRPLQESHFSRAKVRWGLVNTPDATHELITVNEWLERTNTDAIIVLQDGQIVAEHYFGFMKPETRHLLWSTSKSVLSSIAGPSLSSGVNDLASKYAPELTRTGLDGATVRQLLDMQAGIRFREFMSPEEFSRLDSTQKKEWTFATPEMRNADHEFARHLRVQGIAALLPTESPDNGMYDFLLSLDPHRNRQHGECFYYAEPNVMATQLILEKTTRRSYVDHLSDLADRLGFEAAPRITLDRIGTANSNVGLQLTLRDWARWGEWLRTGSTTPTASPDPAMQQFVQDIVDNPQPDKWTEKSNLRQYFPKGTGYRSFFYTTPVEGTSRKRPIIYASGAYDQRLFIDTENGIVFAKFSTITDWENVSPREIVACISFMEETLPTLLDY